LSTKFVSFLLKNNGPFNNLTKLLKMAKKKQEITLQFIDFQSISEFTN